MTTPAFTILRETLVPTAPRPGDNRRNLAITYALAARPPQVVIIRAEELPDLEFLRTHPEETEAPPALIQEGERIRNLRIQQQINRTPRAAE